MKKQLTILGILCACGLLAAEEAPAPQAPDAAKAAPRPQVQRPHRQNRVMQSRLKKVQAAHAKIVARFDADKNGRIDGKEKAVMEKAFAEANEMFMLSLSYNEIKVVDTDGDMVLSEEEMAKAPEQFRKMYQERRLKMQERARLRNEARRERAAAAAAKAAARNDAKAAARNDAKAAARNDAKADAKPADAKPAEARTEAKTE